MLRVQDAQEQWTYGSTNTAGAGRTGAVDVHGSTNTVGAGRTGAVDIHGHINAMGT